MAAPRMRIAPPDLRPLLVLLVSMGILCVVHDVWCLRDGRRVVGGMFGVEKMHSDMLLCQDEVWRFLLRPIMKFVPLNLYQRTLTGDIHALPTGF